MEFDSISLVSGDYQVLVLVLVLLLVLVPGE